MEKELEVKVDWLIHRLITNKIFMAMLLEEIKIRNVGGCMGFLYSQIIHRYKANACPYKKSLIAKSTLKHENNLPEAVMDIIKPIFRDLSNQSILKQMFRWLYPKC